MNKITTLAAISMFAVIMGMTAFAPAMADKPQDTRICHFQAEVIDDDGTVLEVESVSDIIVNSNAEKAHLGDDGNHVAHTNSMGTDFVIDGSEGQTAEDCPVTVEED
jgi:hypothetical protein